MKKTSVAQEIIEIHTLLHPVVMRHLDRMGKHDGAVVSLALNRLGNLAVSAEGVLASADGKEKTPVQPG
jgi:hypothetical protein